MKGRRNNIHKLVEWMGLGFVKQVLSHRAVASRGKEILFGKVDGLDCISEE